MGTLESVIVLVSPATYQLSALRLVTEVSGAVSRVPTYRIIVEDELGEDT